MKYSKSQRGINPSVVGQIVLAACLCQAMTVKAVPFTLGVAGPADWAVLEIGSGNVSIANASNAGYINGNVGVASGGSISDSGTPITGNVYTGGTVSSTVNPNVDSVVSGTISQNNALLTAAINAAISASESAAGMGASGGGVGITSISYNDGLTHTLAPGVYHLSSLVLQNGTTLSLSPGGQYVFDITGQLALNSSKILTAAGLSPGDVLFNFLGTQGPSFSGGLSQESVLDGILLATNAQVSITPGLVDGEIISGANINIASGAQVNGNVPDVASTASMLGLGLGAMVWLRRKMTA